MGIETRRLKNSPWYSVAVVLLGAWLGVFVGWLLMLFTQTIFMVTSGPGAIMVMLPLLAIQSTFGLFIALVIVPIWAIFGGWFVAKFSSGKWGHARRIGITYFSENHPIFIRTQELASELGLPEIKWVGWFDENAVNALALGVKQSAAIIAFSKGAIDSLTKDEFDAVIAHELGHVASNDMATMNFLQGVQASLTWFLFFRGTKRIALTVFLPFSQLEILRLSRKREFWADGVAATLVGSENMIAALEKVRDTPRTLKKTKHVKTLRFQSRWSGLFSTHPSIKKRIQVLREGTYRRRISPSSWSDRISST